MFFFNLFFFGGGGGGGGGGAKTRSQAKINKRLHNHPRVILLNFMKEFINIQRVNVLSQILHHSAPDSVGTNVNYGSVFPQIRIEFKISMYQI